jgi:LysR family transcriptional regulator, regulator for metE and metH
MGADLIRYSNLDLRHFRLVLAVTEAKNLTAAARRLHLTTSALSHQLRQLESIANTRVFVRDGRSMRPTRVGEMLFDTAERVLESVYDAEEQLRSDGVVHAESIRLCSHCYTGYHWLPAVLDAFKQTHPKVDVRIVPDETRRPFDGLHENRLDLVISFAPSMERGLATKFLFRDDLLLLVSKKHRLARQRFVNLRELREEHLILYTHSINESLFVQQHLAPANIRPKRFTGIALTEGILEMVKANLGVTVLARWAAQRVGKRDGVVAKKLTKTGLKRNWYAVTRERPKKGSAVAALIDRLREDMHHFAERARGSGPRTLRK